MLDGVLETRGRHGEVNGRLRLAPGGERIDESAAKRIAAGGSWTTPARFATPETVRAFPEFFKTRDVGFRVVRVEK